MTCVSSSNSTSLGRDGEINGAIGSDQVNTGLASSNVGPRNIETILKWSVG